eukprot:2813352-Amphidinium_carterae.1
MMGIDLCCSPECPQHCRHIVSSLENDSDKQPSLDDMKETLVRVLVSPAWEPHKQAGSRTGVLP